MKKQISILTAVILVAISIFVGTRIERFGREQKGAPDYGLAITNTMTLIHMQAQLSMFMCTMISNTWNSAQRNIFANERDKVARLTSDLERRGFYRMLEGNNKKISADLEKLQNPPDKFREAYTSLLDLNNYGLQLYNMAKSPGGTVDIYDNNVSSKFNELITAYNKIIRLLPR